MSRKNRNATLFVPVLVLVTALVSAQAGWSATTVIVTANAFTTTAPFTLTVSLADAANLAPGMVELSSPGAGPLITAVNTATGVVVLTAQALPTGTALPIILAFATPMGQDTFFQVRYVSNLAIGDSVVNITNDGATGGNICANVYTFSPDEQLISCCSCVVTPNGLVSLSANSDLVSNTLTPAHPTSIVVKLIASPGAACNPSSVTTFASGMLAWGTSLHAAPTTPVTYQVNETAFSNAGLSPAELARVTSLCGFIQANGSGFGICKSCRLGGLGAVAQ